MSIKKLSAFFADESGVSMVEYCLVAALIAVVAIGALTTIGGSVTTQLGTIGTALQ